MSFSEKQMEILKFPYSRNTALICDGAVRSGKTSVMSLSFVLWAMSTFNHVNFGLCGKTVASAERNVIKPLLGIKYLKDNFAVKYSFSDHVLTMRRGNKTNYFYVFGGKDESSYTLIQGITLAGVLLDEVALMPRSFVDQALARCSVEGSKYWFNCNPEGPQHWFYQEWILHPEKHNAQHIHFLLDDNPSLSDAKKQEYYSNYTGVFYDRYILGQWVVAEGLIYSYAAHGGGIVPPDPQRKYTKYYVSMDYGTLNPCSMGLWGLCDGVWYRMREYYHSGRDTRNQLTDEQYYTELVKLIDNLPVRAVIIDPSAASMITTILQKRRYAVINANNEVVDGIRRTAVALQTGKIKIFDCCADTIAEFSAYRWDEKSSDDKPIKENDHAMDDIRYFVNTVLYGSDAKFVNVEI